LLEVSEPQKALKGAGWPDTAAAYAADVTFVPAVKCCEPMLVSIVSAFAAVAKHRAHARAAAAAE
jgi:hypothetical protein